MDLFLAVEARDYSVDTFTRDERCCCPDQVFRQLCIGSRLNRTLLPGPELEKKIAGAGT